MAASTILAGTDSVAGDGRLIEGLSATKGADRRRRISAEDGRALEMLGHAIEYLSDEYSYEDGSFPPGDPQVQAMQMLMQLNREIYFSCPEVPSLRDRFRAWLGARAA